MAGFGMGAFGAPSAFGSTPFGSTPTFGAPQTQSAFGSSAATGVWPSATPAFGQQTPAFGATPTPSAFGTPFGQTTSAFGAPTSTPAFGFGAQPSSTPAFGQTSAFGSATPAFGSTTPTPAFGQTSSAFGAAAPAFGATTSTPAFGQSTSPFGSSLTPSLGFGASTSAFGATPTPAFGAGATSSPAFGAFGSTLGGAVPTGTRSIPFNPFTEAEQSSTGGVTQNNRYMSISAMPQYKTKCPEELRWEDYQAGFKGGSGLPTPASNPFGAPAAPATTSLFGSTQPTMGMSFGQTQPSTNPFGTPAPAFGTTPTPAFGTPQPQQSLFGSTTPSTSTNPFGAPATPAPTFGTTPTLGGFGLQQPSSMPSFGAPSTTPSLFGGGGGMFGAPSSTPAFGSAASTPSLFGASSSTPAFGVPQSSPSLFGSTAAPASTGFGFGGFGSTSASAPATSGGLFGGGGLMAGATTSVFGSTPLSSGFGGFGVAKPAASATPFGAPPASSPSPFSFGASTGAASAPAFSFGGATTTPAAPSSTPGPFSFSQTPAPTFGGLGSSTPGLSTGGMFGSSFGAPASATPSLFGTPSMTATPQVMTTPLPPMSQSQPYGQMPAMPSFAGLSATPGGSLSLTPFGNAPLASATGLKMASASPPPASLLAPRTITPRSAMRVRPRRHTPGGYPPSGGGAGSGSSFSSLFSMGTGDQDGDSPPSSAIARSSLFATQDDPRRLFIRPDAMKPSPNVPSASNRNNSNNNNNINGGPAQDAASPSSPPRPRPSAQRADDGLRASAPRGGGNENGFHAGGRDGSGPGPSRDAGGDSPRNSFSLAGRPGDGEASPSLANNGDGYASRRDDGERDQGDHGRGRGNSGGGDGFAGFPHPQGSNDASDVPTTGRLFFGDQSPDSSHLPAGPRGGSALPGSEGYGRDSPGNTAGSGSNANSSSMTRMIKPQPSPAATAPTAFYTRLCRAVGDGHGPSGPEAPQGSGHRDRGDAGGQDRAGKRANGSDQGFKSAGDVGDGWQSSTKAGAGGRAGASVAGAGRGSSSQLPREYAPEGDNGGGDIKDYRLPFLDNAEYVTDPGINDLVRMAHGDPGSLERVQGFTVGRRGVGQVQFLGEVDVRGLGNLNNIVRFSPGEVYVYPSGGDQKPPVGKGLNRPAEVTLYGVFPRDRDTGKPSSDPAVLEKFARRLRRAVEKDTGGGGRFVDYDPRDGRWTFRVQHFSRYGVPQDSDDDDDDDEEEEEEEGGLRVQGQGQAAGAGAGRFPHAGRSLGAREFSFRIDGNTLEDVYGLEGAPWGAAGARRPHSAGLGGDVSMEEDDGEEGQGYSGADLGARGDAAVRNLQGALGAASGSGADASFGDGMTMMEEEGGAWLGRGKDKYASVAPGVALTHSLPAQLGLDPQRTHVMRSCLFGGPSLDGDDDDDEDRSGQGGSITLTGAPTSTFAPGGAGFPSASNAAEVSGRPGHWVGGRWMPTSGTPVRAPRPGRPTPTPTSTAPGAKQALAHPGQDAAIPSVVTGESGGPLLGLVSDSTVFTRRREGRHGCFRMVSALQSEGDAAAKALLSVGPPAMGDNGGCTGGDGDGVVTGHGLSAMGADAALFLGRSFRVGWDRFGRLWHTDMRVMSAAFESGDSSRMNATYRGGGGQNGAPGTLTLVNTTGVSLHGGGPGSSAHAAGDRGDYSGDVIVVASSRVAVSRLLIDPLVQQPPRRPAPSQGKVVSDGQADAAGFEVGAGGLVGTGGALGSGGIPGAGGLFVTGGALSATQEAWLAVAAASSSASAPLADVALEKAELRYTPGMLLARENTEYSSSGGRGAAGDGTIGGETTSGGASLGDAVASGKAAVAVEAGSASGLGLAGDESKQEGGDWLPRAALQCDRGEKLAELCDGLGVRASEVDVASAGTSNAAGALVVDASKESAVGRAAWAECVRQQKKLWELFALLFRCDDAGLGVTGDGRYADGCDRYQNGGTAQGENQGGNGGGYGGMDDGRAQATPVGVPADGTRDSWMEHDTEAEHADGMKTKSPGAMGEGMGVPTGMFDDEEDVARRERAQRKEELRRRAKFSMWLQTYAKRDNGLSTTATRATASTSTSMVSWAPLGVPASSSALGASDAATATVDPSLRSIFACLSVRDIEGAVAVALASRDVRLATLLANAGGSTGQRAFIADQLHIWRKVGYLPPVTHPANTSTLNGVTSGIGGDAEGGGNPSGADGSIINEATGGGFAFATTPAPVFGSALGGNNLRGVAGSNNGYSNGGQAGGNTPWAIHPLRACIYLVLAGDVEGALDGAAACAGITIDWLRTLGMYLWYHHRPATELVTSLGDFVQMVGERRVPPPVPHYYGGRSLAAGDGGREYAEDEGQWFGEPMTPQVAGNEGGLGARGRDHADGTGGHAGGAGPSGSIGQDGSGGDGGDALGSAGGAFVGLTHGQGQQECMDEVKGPVYDASFYLMQLFEEAKVQASGIQKPDHEGAVAGDAARWLWRRLLRSASFSPNPLDHQMSWHLLCLLSSIGIMRTPGGGRDQIGADGALVAPLTVADANRLHMDFAAQLALLGMPEWAVFVAMHVHNDKSWGALREQAVRELLHLSCDSWDVPTHPLAMAGPSLDQPLPSVARDADARMAKGRFLVQTLRVPLHWLHQSKALWARYRRDPVAELGHHMHGQQYDAAHELLMHTLAPKWFMQGDKTRLVSQLLHFLRDPSTYRPNGPAPSSTPPLVAPIRGWGEGGQLYLDYYRLVGTSLGNVTREECTKFLDRVAVAAQTWGGEGHADDNNATLCRVAFSSMTKAIGDKLVRDLSGHAVGESQAHALACRPYFKCEDYAIAHVQRAAVHLFQCLERPITT